MLLLAIVLCYLVLAEPLEMLRGEVPTNYHVEREREALTTRGGVALNQRPIQILFSARQKIRLIS